MTKETKTLPQAIKIIVGLYGQDVVKDVRMVNIMGDVVTLEDNLAVKTILRDVLKLGYGGKVLAINGIKDDYNIKIKAYTKEISDLYGYKETIVQYVLFSLAYGIGLCPYLPRITKKVPSQRQEDKATPETNQPITTIRLTKGKILSLSIILFFIICVVANYFMANSHDVERFEQRISSGDSFLSSEDYVNAVESYKEAYKGYEGYKSNSYKREALEKIDAVVDQLTEEGQTNNRSLLQASKLIQSELELNLNDNDLGRVKLKKADIDKTIKEKVDNGHNILITIISANNGKLNENGKKILKDLMELSPDDYWLNFINRKSYE